MKVCPKCHSSYTDETLNFCLTDGAPLIDETAIGESQSATDSWQNAETMRDNRVHFSENSYLTTPHSSAPTLPMIDAKTENLPRAQTSKTKFYPVIGAFLLLAALGSGFWWFSQNKNRAAIPAANESDNNVRTVRPAANLSESEQAKIKREITDFIESWRKTNEDREIEAHIEHYANTLDNFYKESGISKNHVRADRQRAYEVYDSIKMEIDNLKITPESETSVIAVFDKSWTFKNEKKTSTGSVEQEQRFVKQNGKWLIVGEKDVMVHFINNRVNPEANADSSSSANPTSSAASNSSSANQSAAKN
jgi:type IV secretory pathway TrbF-like protein